MGAAKWGVLGWVLHAFTPLLKARPEAAEQTMPSRTAPHAPGNDPGGPPSSEVKGKAAAPLHQPSQSSPDKACLWGAGPGEGARAGLSGGKQRGRVARQIVLEEKWESGGERAALPSHHPPSHHPGLLLLAFASPSLASERGKPLCNSWNYFTPT